MSSNSKNPLKASLTLPLVKEILTCEEAVRLDEYNKSIEESYDCGSADREVELLIAIVK
jgi:hypothetical protein